MLIRFLLAAALAAGLSSAAQAQNARTVTTCGAAQDARAGDTAGLTRDTFGNLCTTGGSSGGGGGSAPASSAYSVQRTSGIGTTGSLVSAADATNRRTVTNTSGLACELVTAPGNAYGTGFPLPAGGSFTFDASGRTTAAIYVACASTGGTVAVLSY